MQAAKDAVRPLLLRIAEVLVNAALQLRHGQNHIVTGLLRGRGHFSGRIGHFLCDRFDGLLRAVHHFFPRVRDGLHGLLCGALEFFGGAVVDVVGIVCSLHHALDVTHNVARSGKDLLRRFGDGIRQLFGVSSRFGGMFFACSAAATACGDDGAAVGFFYSVLFFQTLAVFFPVVCVLFSGLFVLVVVVKSFLVDSIPVAVENAYFSAFQRVKDSFQANSRRFGLVNDGGKTCYFPDKATPSVKLISFLCCDDHVVQLANRNADAAG